MLIRLWFSAVLLLPVAASARGFHWDVPQQVESVNMSGALSASGIPVHLHAAVSKLDYHALEAHYARAFEAAGLYVAPPDQQQVPTRYPELTALDVDHRISYTVILQPDADGSTTVIMGEANLASPPPDPTPFAPLYPGADRVTRMRDEGSSTVLFAVPAEPKAVSAYYTKALLHAGYRRGPPPRLAVADGGTGPVGAPHSKLFVRHGEWIRLTTRTGAKAPKQVWVVLQHGKGPPPGTTELR